MVLPKVGRRIPMANFNCAFEVIDDFESFRDLFYLLMIGCGVGFRVLKAMLRNFQR